MDDIIDYVAPMGQENLTPIEQPAKPPGKKRGRKTNAERLANANSEAETVLKDDVTNPSPKNKATKRKHVVDEAEIIQFGKQIQGLHEIGAAISGLQSVRLGEEASKQVANSIVVICEKFGIDLFGTMGIVGAVATLAVVYVPMTIQARAEYQAKYRQPATVDVNP
jgi:lysozyme family protein